jgi:hypothetical protein
MIQTENRVIQARSVNRKKMLNTKAKRRIEDLQSQLKERHERNILGRKCLLPNRPPVQSSNINGNTCKASRLLHMMGVFRFSALDRTNMGVFRRSVVWFTER